MRSKRLLDVDGQWVLSHCEPSLPGKPGGWVSWAARGGTVHVTAPLVAMHWWVLTRRALESRASPPRPRRARARSLPLPIGGCPGCERPHGTGHHPQCPYRWGGPMYRPMLPDATRWLAAKELAS